MPSRSSATTNRIEARQAGLPGELCRLAADLGSQGWCQATAGNFSAVLSRSPLRLLITPSGADKRTLEPRDLIVVEGTAARPAFGGGCPSAEALLHCRIAAETEAGAVAHVHSVPATLLSAHFAAAGGFHLSGFEMLKGFAGISTHETEVFVPVLDNSQDMPALADRVGALLASRPAVPGFLLARHGLYAWGEDPVAARRHTETFEFLFECLAWQIFAAPPSRRPEGG